MPQNTKPHKNLQQTPQQRLVNLQAQLSHAELLKGLTEHKGFDELLKITQTEANRRRKGAQAIGWDSTADEFQAFEKKSLYAAGYIQGVEFAYNVLSAIPMQHAALERDVKALAEEIRGAKKK